MVEPNSLEYRQRAVQWFRLAQVLSPLRSRRNRGRARAANNVNDSGDSMQYSRYNLIPAVMLLMLATSCSSTGDDIDGLSPSSSNEEIMMHMLDAANSQRQTDQLARHFPDLDRSRAYAIQRARLEHGLKTSTQVGWKLGWSRLAGPDDTLDPIVGHYLNDRVFSEDRPVSTRFFTDGVSNAEPEVVFYLNRDLPGPVVTREEVIAAIDSVGIAMEFVNWRAAEPRTREHAIADNGIVSGVILGEDRFNLDDIDFSSLVGRVEVNGSEVSDGPATSIMGEDPLAGLVWAANELPKWGMHLKAGDFVLSGTVCVPLPVTAGDSAVVSFNGMGSIEAQFVE